MAWYSDSQTLDMDYGRGIDIFSIFAFWDTDFMIVNILQENVWELTFSQLLHFGIQIL